MTEIERLVLAAALKGGCSESAHMLTDDHEHIGDPEEP